MERIPATEFEGEPVNRLAPYLKSGAAGLSFQPPSRVEAAIAELVRRWAELSEQSPEKPQLMAEIAENLIKGWDEAAGIIAQPSDQRASYIQSVRSWLRHGYAQAALLVAEWFVERFGDEDGVLRSLADEARADLQAAEQGQQKEKPEPPGESYPIE